MAYELGADRCEAEDRGLGEATKEEKEMELTDKQLGDMFELCNWVITESMEADNQIPWHIYRIAVGLLNDKQKELEDA